MEDALELQEAPLDTLDEREEITRTEQTMDDLCGLFGTIVEQNGLNKSMAVTIESIDSDILPEHCPIESYTESFTRTNLQPTLEAMKLKTGRLLQTLIQAVIKLMKKIMNWVKEVITNTFGKKAKAQESHERALILNQAKEQINNDLSQSVGKNIEEIERDVEREIAGLYKNKFNLLDEAVAENGKFKEDMRIHGGRFVTYLTIAERRMRLLKETIKQLPRRESDLYEGSEMLKRQILAQMKQVHEDKEGVDVYALREKMRGLVEEKESLKSKKLKSDPDRSLANQWLGNGKFDPSEDYLNSEKAVKEKINDLVDGLKDLERSKVNITDNEIAGEFRQAFDSLKQVVDAYSDYARCLGEIYDSSLKITYFILDFPKLYVERLAQEIKAKGTKEDKEHIKDVVEKARKRAKLR